MKFTIQTNYTARRMVTMARVLRKTVRKKHSRRSHLFGWIILLCAGAVSVRHLIKGDAMDTSQLLVWIAFVLLLVTLLWEDQINGYLAYKRMMAGTETNTTDFLPEQYVTTTAVGTTTWHYDKILLIAETKDAFVFVFDKRYAQIYDKQTLQGGDVEEFRKFLSRATQKDILKTS